MFNQYGGSRADTLVKLVLIFFISLLSFSIGTFVGKQFSDSQHLKMANDGEADEAFRDTASVDPKSLDVAPQDALTDEDLANLDDEFASTKKEEAPKTAEAGHGAEDEHHGEEAHGEHESKTADTEKSHETIEAPKVSDVHKDVESHKEEAAHKVEADHKEVDSHKVADTHGEKAETAHETHAASGVSKSLEAVHEVAKRVSENKPPVEAKKNSHERVPSSMPVRSASDSVGKYTVQVSSFNNETEASNLSKELVSKGFSAFYLAADVNGKTWYRVGVGLHGTAAEAKKARTDLLKQPEFKTAIVQKITKDASSAHN